jgi:hypothetical protein
MWLEPVFALCIVGILFPCISYVGNPVPKRTRVKDYFCLRLKYNTSVLANFLTQYISHVEVLKCIQQGLWIIASGLTEFCRTRIVRAWTR